MGFLYFGLGGALMGAIWVFFTGLILHDNYSKEQSGDWFVYLFYGPLFLLGVLFTILMPIISSMELWPGPLDLPIMFDRRMRKVYKLIEQRDVSGRVKQRGRVGILEYDWEDVLASHRVSTVFIGNGASAQRNHSLWLLVRDKDAKGFEGAITPVNQPPYIDEIALPAHFVLNEHNAPRVWEHIRRYMNENGPALPWGEQLADTSVPVTWWDSLGAVSVFGPGYIKRWRESWGWMLIMHLLSPLMLPLAILMATTNWLSYKTAYPVAWPQEILDKVGPPLTPEQLHPPITNEPRRQRAQRKRKA